MTITETRAPNGQRLTKITGSAAKRKAAQRGDGEPMPPEAIAERARLQALIAGATLYDVEPKDLSPSPFHKRRVWGDLEELAATIVTVGIVEPLLGRPKAGAEAGVIELVFGHRRQRAIALAMKHGWAGKVPVRVAALTDADVVTVMAIENLQREDLHPLEEAEEYEQLIKVAKIPAEEIGARIGRSRSHVYGRIKLLNLCPEARKAFAEDRIPASVALYVARIPHPKLQIEALKHLVTREGDDPIGARHAFRIIEGRYMLRLADASFDRDDAALVPEAGSCTDCGKRTGNQRELFADVKSADVCTDPPCFAAKRAAGEKKKRAELEAKGVKVLEAKRHPHSPDYVPVPPGFEPMDQKHYAHGNKKVDGKSTRELLKAAKLEDVEPVVYFDGQGNAVKLAPAAAVKAAKKKLGAGEPTPPKAAAKGPKLSRAQAHAIATLEEEIGEQIVTLAAKKPGGDATWRLLALILAPYLAKSVARLSGSKLATRVLTEAMSNGAGTDLAGEELGDAAKLFGIDYGKRVKEALAALEAGDDE